MTSIAMTAPRRRSSSDHILRTAARGAVLIGVAVVIGIVLLQVVDNGGGGGGGSATPASSSTGDDTTSTTAADTGRPAQEVRVFVANGSGVSGAAATKANELRGLGYQTSTGNAAVQQGTTVACVEGFEAEAQQLVTTIAGSTLATFPSPAPAGAESVDCIVTLGK